MNRRRIANLILSIIITLASLPVTGASSPRLIAPLDEETDFSDAWSIAENGTSLEFLLFGHADSVSVDIEGLLPGEKIEHIDSIPDSDNLVGFTSEGNVYVIDPDRGRASLELFRPNLKGLNITDIDYNPVKDLIVLTEKNGHRVELGLSGSENDLRPTEYAPGDPNQGKTPNLTGLGYTNSAKGVTNTTAFATDSAQNTLAKMDGTTGKLETVGNLGVDASKVVGFDINALTSKGYALLVPPGQTIPELHEIDLTTGKSKKITSVGKPVKGLAVEPRLPKDFHCVLTPPTATNRVGTNHTMKLTVFDGGKQITSGFVAGVRVIEGPNKEQEIGNESNPEFSYSGNNPGEDTIEITANTIDGKTCRCTAKKKWVNPPFIDDLIRKGKKLTAKGFFDPNSQNSLLVDGFEKSIKRQSDTEIFSKKGGKGIEIGSKVMVTGGGNESNEFIFGETVPDLDCVITPLMATNKLGETHRIEVQVFVRGQLVSGDIDRAAIIRIGPNTDIALTELEPQQFFYTSGKEGLDVIEFIADIQGKRVTCRAFKRWVKP